MHVFGTPFFIEADLPLSSAPYRHTMIAQDTGSAIVGPARADIYFGAGDQAGQMASRVRQAGRFTMLLPSEIVLDVPEVRVPLATPKADDNSTSASISPANDIERKDGVEIGTKTDVSGNQSSRCGAQFGGPMTWRQNDRAQQHSAFLNQ